MYTIIVIVYVIDVWSQKIVIVSIFPEVYPGEANTNLIPPPPPKTLALQDQKLYPGVANR